MIAARTVLTAADGAYVFKIAYDEQYARQSPGTLLEIEAIAQPLPGGAQWADSSTAPANPTYKHICVERRTIHDILLAPGPSSGKLAASLLPLLRWANRGLRRR